MNKSHRKKRKLCPLFVEGLDGLWRPCVREAGHDPGHEPSDEPDDAVPIEDAPLGSLSLHSDEDRWLSKVLADDMLDPPLGRFDTLGMDAYHAGPGLSSTETLHLLRSVSHWLCQARSPKDSAALIFGSLVHCAVFEPDLLRGRYFSHRAPGRCEGKYQSGPRAGERCELDALAGAARCHMHGGTRDHETLLDAHPGQIFIVAGDWRRAFAVRDQVYRHVVAHPKARDVLTGGQFEISFFAYTDDGDPLRVLRKARTDSLLIPKETIVDLKTEGRDGRLASYTGHAYALGYHTRAAWYVDTVEAALDGFAVKRFVHLVVESEEPYGVQLYKYDADAIRAGRAQCARALERFREWARTGDAWGDAYTTRLQTLSLPRYALERRTRSR